MLAPRTLVYFKADLLVLVVPTAWRHASEMGARFIKSRRIWHQGSASVVPSKTASPPLKAVVENKYVRRFTVVSELLHGGRETS